MSDARDTSAAEARARGLLALVAMGVATSDLRDVSYDKLKRSFRDTLSRDSIDSILAVVLGGSYLFYLAEKDTNPRVTTFLDALVFITTCLTVGSDDIFARTEPGKAIATFVMTFGPSLAASALAAPAEAPAPAPPPDGAPELNRAILGRLDAILEALRAPGSL